MAPAVPRAERGFTLIELLMVSMIIGLLAIILIAKFKRAIDQAHLGQTLYNRKALQTAVDIMVLDHPDEADNTRGDFPPVISDYPPSTSWCATGCDVNGWGGSGGNRVCQAWLSYFTTIPPNTFNRVENNNTDQNFIWNSPVRFTWMQYPSSTDGGFFFSRKFRMIMLNNNQKYEDGRFYYEMGQGWRSNGVGFSRPSETGFGGPWDEGDENPT